MKIKDSFAFQHNRWATDSSQTPYPSVSPTLFLSLSLPPSLSANLAMRQIFHCESQRAGPRKDQSSSMPCAGPYIAREFKIRAENCKHTKSNRGASKRWGTRPCWFKSHDAILGNCIGVLPRSWSLPGRCPQTRPLFLSACSVVRENSAHKAIRW